MGWLGIETLSGVEDADWMSVSAGEEILEKENPHVINYILPASSGVLLMVMWTVLVFTVEFVPNVTAVLSLVPGVALIGFAFLKWKTTIYVLTTSKIHKRWGVFDEDTATVRIDKVQNTGMSLNYFERLVGFGDVEIFTSGSGGQDMFITNIPGAKKWNKLINELMDEVGKDADTDVGGEGLRWVPADDEQNPGYQ